jgi:hypothetical protein
MNNLCRLPQLLQLGGIGANFAFAIDRRERGWGVIRVARAHRGERY